MYRIGGHKKNEMQEICHPGTYKNEYYDFERLKYD